MVVVFAKCAIYIPYQIYYTIGDVGVFLSSMNFFCFSIVEHFSSMFNPLTAGAAYIWFFIFYQQNKYHLLNMLKIKSDIKQQGLQNLTPILSHLNNSHSLEVVDRVSETQLQVG